MCVLYYRRRHQIKYIDDNHDNYKTTETSKEDEMMTTVTALLQLSLLANKITQRQ